MMSTLQLLGPGLCLEVQEELFIKARRLLGPHLLGKCQDEKEAV